MPELLTTPEDPTLTVVPGEDYDAEKFKKLSDREHVRLSELVAGRAGGRAASTVFRGQDPEWGAAR